MSVSTAVVSTAVGLAIALLAAWKLTGSKTPDRLTVALCALFVVFVLGAVAIAGP